MRILDRHIMVRMSLNFVLLFLLLYLFAATIDVILNLEHFDEVARQRLGDDAGFFDHADIIGLAFNSTAWSSSSSPTSMDWLRSVRGFTATQMSRNRELVAMLASGMSLYRASMPFLAVVFGLGLLPVRKSSCRIGPVAAAGSQPDRDGKHLLISDLVHHGFIGCIVQSPASTRLPACLIRRRSFFATEVSVAAYSCHIGHLG